MRITAFAAAPNAHVRFMNAQNMQYDLVSRKSNTTLHAKKTIGKVAPYVEIYTDKPSNSQTTTTDDVMKTT